MVWARKYAYIINAEDPILLAYIPSPNVRSDVFESLNRDLSKVSTWCNLWGIS